MTNVYFIGAGPGETEYLLPQAADTIMTCDVLIGAKRHLEKLESVYKNSPREIRVIENTSVDDILSWVIDNAFPEVIGNNFGIIVSGDPGIFSIYGAFVNKMNEPENRGKLPENVSVFVVPGISALSVFASKINKIWQNAAIISIHGRSDFGLIQKLFDAGKAYVFTGPHNSPDIVCKRLSEFLDANFEVYIGENLTLENEKIHKGNVEDFVNASFAGLSMMYIEVIGKSENAVTHGISDDRFVRGNVPMTKEEIRTISLSKLKLSKNSILFDIGAGTGSISVEAGLMIKSGRVYAIERNPEACDLIRTNANKLGAFNVEVIETDAPKGLERLSVPDRIFIGGSGENIIQIFEWIARIPNKVRVVVNSVTIDTAFSTLKTLEKLNFENIEVIQAIISKGSSAGKKTMLKAANPVFIISADSKTAEYISKLDSTVASIGSENKGVFYGLGVGPGDKRLITVKAVKILENIDVVAYPHSKAGKDSVALNIATEYVKKGCELLELYMPMSQNLEEIDKCHDEAVRAMEQFLESGKNIAFITLGDPSIFSTFSYLREKVELKGYQTQVVPGITSFTAAGAISKTILAEGDDILSIIPATCDEDKLKRSIKYCDKFVIMKVSANYNKIISILDEEGLLNKAALVERCGMDGENIVYNISDYKGIPGYFAMLIVDKGV